jgi:Beta-L-arabinofuranosidase, GH127 catalytic domain/Beta-L-arabinofuranosidase, GH127 middle domain
MLRTVIPCAIALLLASASGHAAETKVEVLDRPALGTVNEHYVGNRPPLQATAFLKLPVGAVTPGGWLREIMQRQRQGLTGHLSAISAWLQKEDNAWLSADGRGAWGWEEVPYWLKGYGNLGYILSDEAMIEEARTWIEAAFESQRETGDFGPIRRFQDDDSQDFWGNMIMLFCLQSYYEYSGDQRVLELMTEYFRYQLTVPDKALLTHYWQRMRGGDNLHSIFWLYNRTGDEWLLELAAKMHRNTADWTMENDLPNWHNVNVAQGFREPAQYWQLSGEASHLRATYRDFRLIREQYGQVPGGMFGSDEICRPGFDDPRQGIETCGIVEQMFSDELLHRLTGDPFWADHCELVAFNTLPAAFMPDMKSLRYLTSPNMAVSDSANHSPGIHNAGPFLMMNPFSSRCCQHNHTQGWPYFCESLWAATPDNGVVAALYAPCEVTVCVGAGQGTLVTIAEQTRYPFEDTIEFSVDTPRAVRFPLYVRVPAWCWQPALAINGKRVEFANATGRYIRLEREWRAGDRVSLRLPMELAVKIWEKNHGSVSVSYGPLTFSLRIGEEYRRFDSIETAIGDSQWQAGADPEQWPSWEIHPTGPWNYGLELAGENPAASFTVERRPWPKDDFPFTEDAAPLLLRAQGRRIPGWQLDRYGLCAPLQDSPVRSVEPIEDLTLIPLGAARLRISAFPVLGTGPEATDWQPPVTPKRLYEAHASHCCPNDSTAAIADDLIPTESNDHTIPRHTFWPHEGTKEWLEARFETPHEVSEVSVYWFDDSPHNGGCSPPNGWSLLYLDGAGAWQDVNTAGAHGVAADRFNTVTFQPVRTKALRLEVELREGRSAGVLEWQVR